MTQWFSGSVWWVLTTSLPAWCVSVALYWSNTIEAQLLFGVVASHPTCGCLIENIKSRLDGHEAECVVLFFLRLFFLESLYPISLDWMPRCQAKQTKGNDKTDSTTSWGIVWEVVMSDCRNAAHCNVSARIKSALLST